MKPEFVYVVVGGWHYEGSQPLRVFFSEDEAKAYIRLIEDGSGYDFVSAKRVEVG